MIEFVLDGRSKVNTYMQLVQQVKQALRVGLVEPGDKLPKVRDVAQSLAINPNTVLKAYRELEIEGLVEGRPGSARSSRTLAGAPWPTRPNCARTSSPGSPAQAAGLTDEDVVALVETTMRATPPTRPQEGARMNGTGGQRMDMALETDRLGKRYGARWAVRDCSLHLPAGRVAALVGPNGAGKTTLLHLAVGLLGPTRARSGSSAAAVRQHDSAWPTSGSSPRTPRCTGISPPPSWSPWAAS